jgi:hypothetical protein
MTYGDDHVHASSNITTDLRITRSAAAAAAVALALGLVLSTALPALADPGHDHGHSHGAEDGDFADPVIWDGSARLDCTVAGEDTIVWTLTGSAGVEYAELHIDEPVRSVTSRNAAPYVWVSPLYALDEIGADADRILGELSANATLNAVYCPAGGAGSAGPSTLITGVGGGVAVGAALGLLVGRRRSHADSAPAAPTTSAN